MRANAVAGNLELFCADWSALAPSYSMVDQKRVRKALHACCRRICSWRVPPNWSATQWFQEIIADALCAACEAERDYDPSRGVPFCGFLYQRVLARALTRYRQEWRFASRFELAAGNTDSEGRLNPSSSVMVPDSRQLNDGELHCALAALPDIDRSIIEQIFWHERTEAELAQTIGISQPAVNKRKRLALLKLRALLHEF
jgi:RNA polymerase sporulation-specific sigma factor